ncbi:F0F1 ATP synthase subunit epsilon [Natronospora cellulosivora (SeqCode)]
MASLVKLDIVTPEELVYSEDIEILVAPAIDGEIGILPNHVPLVTGLDTGILRIKKDGEELKVPISDGFMEVKPDGISVVVRTAELPHHIDPERAAKALERAKKRMTQNDNKIDQARAKAALERAIARLKAVEKY